MREIIIGIVVLLFVICLPIRSYISGKYIKDNSMLYKEMKGIISWYDGKFAKYPTSITNQYAFDTKSKFDNENNHTKVIEEYFSKE